VSPELALRLAARALYGMDDARVLDHVTCDALRTASRRLGWAFERGAVERYNTKRFFELWSKNGRIVDLPMATDGFYGPRDVSAWATGLAGVEIAPSEALACVLEEILP
jgi:hypothetical protein